MNNFDILNQFIRKQQKQENNRPKPSKKKLQPGECPQCGVIGKIITNFEAGFDVCTNCGIQLNQIMEHQNGFEGNVQNKQKAAPVRLIVEDDAQIIRFVTNFISIVFSGNRDEKSTGRHVAGIVRGIREERKLQGKEKGYLRGYQMSEIVICILFCVFVQQKRAMPISMMTYLMNNMLNESLKEYKMASLLKVEKLRFDKKVGISSYLAKSRIDCLSNKPSDFISFPMNLVLLIQDKDIHRIVKDISDELFKEFPNMSISPSVVACGVMNYVCKYYTQFDPKIFGLPPAKLKQISTKIENSKNPKIKNLLLEM